MLSTWFFCRRKREISVTFAHPIFQENAPRIKGLCNMFCYCRRSYLVSSNILQAICQAGIGRQKDSPGSGLHICAQMARLPTSRELPYLASWARWKSRCVFAQQAWNPYRLGNEAGIWNLAIVKLVPVGPLPDWNPSRFIQ